MTTSVLDVPCRLPLAHADDLQLVALMAKVICDLAHPCNAGVDGHPDVSNAVGLASSESFDLPT
eukprot:1299384-Amphidinium_carterae.1